MVLELSLVVQKSFCIFDLHLLYAIGTAEKTENYMRFLFYDSHSLYATHKDHYVSTFWCRVEKLWALNCLTKTILVMVNLCPFCLGGEELTPAPQRRIMEGLGVCSFAAGSVIACKTC